MNQRPRREPLRSFDDRPFLRYCGNLFRTQRLAQGLTAEDVAAMVGISDGALGKFENGRQWLRPKTLLHIASCLQIPFSLLFGDDPASPHAALRALLQTAPPELHARLYTVCQEMFEVFHLAQQSGKPLWGQPADTFPLAYQADGKPHWE